MSKFKKKSFVRKRVPQGILALGGLVFFGAVAGVTFFTHADPRNRVMMPIPQPNQVESRVVNEPAPIPSGAVAIPAELLARCERAGIPVPTQAETLVLFNALSGIDLFARDLGGDPIQDALGSKVFPYFQAIQNTSPNDSNLELLRTYLMLDRGTPSSAIAAFNELREFLGPDHEESRELQGHLRIAVTNLQVFARFQTCGRPSRRAHRASAPAREEAAPRRARPAELPAGALEGLDGDFPDGL